MAASESPRLMLASPGARVLVVGSGGYAPGSRLSPVPSVADTVADLGRCLVERARLDPANLTTLVDPAGPQEFGTALVETVRQAKTVLVVYYVGHGLVSADNELHLATRSTIDLNEGIAAHQALPYSTVGKVLSECAAPLIVVVLDCCFSGRARGATRGDVGEVFDTIPQGSYVLAAANRDEAAWTPPGQRHTAFTGAMIRLLTTGDPTAPSMLTLDDVYRCLSRTLPEDGFPRPRRQATDHGDRRLFAPNPAHRAGSALDRPGDFSPYRGLAAFGPEDADYFFGRTDLTRVLVDRVAEQLAEAGPLMVTGPSGSGKSSLLRAGLIPALRRSSETDVVLLTPGGDPVGALTRRFAPLDGTHPADLRQGVEADPANLRNTLNRTAQDRPLVLIVDQFEEVFTACPDERQQRIFIRALHALCTASDDKGPVAVVVIGVRADFFGHCAAHRELVPTLERSLVVSPMTTSQLREAIEGPARLADITLQAGLVDLLLEDLGMDRELAVAEVADNAVAGSNAVAGTANKDRAASRAEGGGVLPLLSHALLATWQHREGRTLTMAAYRATGGISRSLAQSADKVLGDLDLASRRCARLTLTRLVRLGHGREDTRRRVPIAELLPPADSPQHAATRRAIDAFVRARLLSVDENAVEIAHEALIRAWPQLRRWIETDRAALLVHQQLGEDADRWAGHDHDPAFLYQGTRLTSANEAYARWEADPARYPAMTDVHRRFLQAGDHAAARVTRRRRLTVISLVALLLVALTGAGTATSMALQAAHEQNLSLSRQLAAQSESIGDTDIRLSRRLSTAAWHIAHTDEAHLSMLHSYLSPERATLTGHTGGLSAVAFSPDGTRLATASGDNAVRLWDATGKRTATLRGHADRVEAIAFSPDGTRLATASADRTARLWDVRTGRRTAVLGGHHDAVLAVAFSPDGKRVATISADNTAKLWDAVTGEATITVRLRIGAVFAVAFSPRGTHFAASGSDNSVRLWEITTGRPVAIFADPTQPVDEPITAIAFGPDGTRVAAASDDGTVRLWNTTSGKAIVLPNGHTSTVSALAFSPDGTRLATPGDDGTTRLWHTTTGKLIATLTGHTGDVTALAFTSDSSYLATASTDKTVRLWDVGTGRPAVTLTGHTDSVSAMAFSPDGTRLATASGDGTARLWDTTTVKPLAKFTGRGPNPNIDPLSAVVISADGSRLAIAGPGHTIGLWDTTTVKSTTALTGDVPMTSMVVLSPDGTRLATSDAENGIRLWDTTAGKSTIALSGRFPVDDMAFSPDGSRLATRGKDNIVRLWDTTTGKPTTTIVLGLYSYLSASMGFGPRGTHLATIDNERGSLWDTSTGKRTIKFTGHVYAMAFGPYRTHLIVVGDGHIGRLWDIATGKPTTTITGRTNSLSAVALSTDGARFATAEAGQTIRLWDTTTGELINTLIGHTGTINSMSFSPDGTRLASGSGDKAQLWDTSSGELINTFTGHTGSIDGVEFSPDGRHLITTSDDKTARIWNAAIPSDLSSAVCALSGGSLTPGEWARYLPDEPFQRVCGQEVSGPVRAPA